MQHEIPLLLSSQPEGGYTVTSPLSPKLVSEGDTIEDVLENVQDTVAAVVEIHNDFGLTLSSGFR
jgi:antitoxin HicB